MKIGKTLLPVVLILAFLQTGTGPNLYAQEPYFKSKQIRIIVGLSSGGGYDRAARLIARHIGKYIPGNPDMVVQNMPGPARSLRPTMSGAWRSLTGDPSRAAQQFLLEPAFRPKRSAIRFAEISVDRLAGKRRHDDLFPRRRAV